jgi:hypothetical protein
MGAPEPEDLPAILESFDRPVPAGRPPHARRLVTSRITRFLPGQYLTWVPGSRSISGGVWFSLPDALLASRVAKEFTDAVMRGDSRDGRPLVIGNDDLTASARRLGPVPIRWLEPGAPQVALSPEIPRKMADDRVTVILPHVPELTGLIGEAARFFAELARLEAGTRSGGSPWRVPAPLAGGVARQAFDVLTTLWSGVTGEVVDTVVRGPDGKRISPMVRRLSLGRRQLATLAAANDVIAASAEPEMRVDTDLSEILGHISVAWPAALVAVLESYDTDAELLTPLFTADDLVLTDRERDAYLRLAGHWSLRTARC